MPGRVAHVEVLVDGAGRAEVRVGRADQAEAERIHAEARLLHQALAERLAHVASAAAPRVQRHGVAESCMRAHGSFS